MRKIALMIGTMAFALSVSSANANEFKPQIEDFFTQNVKAWLSDPKVIEAIKQQNEKHAALASGDIDALDQQWRSEAKSSSGPLIDEILANPLSAFLIEKKGMHEKAITEMFVMDNKGLNVGQSDVTSDYMQGDEAKWQKTYGSGAEAVFVDEVEFDESTNSFQSQISSTIIDPATNQPIGAITIGLNVENLL